MTARLTVLCFWQSNIQTQSHLEVHCSQHQKHDTAIDAI